MTRPPFAIDAIDHVLLLGQGTGESLAFYKGVPGAVLESQLPNHAMVDRRVGRSHVNPAARTAETSNASLSRSVGVIEERSEEGLEGRSLSLYHPRSSGNQIELILPL